MYVFIVWETTCDEYFDELMHSIHKTQAGAIKEVENFKDINLYTKINDHMWSLRNNKNNLPMSIIIEKTLVKP